MNNKITLLILFILFPFSTILIDMIFIGKYENISYLVKTITIFLLFFIIILYKKKGWNDEISKRFILLTISWSLPYILHLIKFSLDYNYVDFGSIKEILRIISIFIVIIILKRSYPNETDVLFLGRWLFISGFVIGIFSIYFSKNYFPEQLAYMKVTDYVRAGIEISDPNMLAVFFNICFFPALGFLIIEKAFIKKLFFMISILVIILGRAHTFSNAGWIGMIIGSISLLLILDKKYKKIAFKYLSILAICFFILIYALNINKTILYRLLLSDKYVRQSSIESRLLQYSALKELLSKKPYLILTGIGSTPEQPEIYQANEMTLHNSFLRPLLVGGLIAFLSYILINIEITIIFVKAYKNYKNIRKDVYLLIMCFFSSYVTWAFQSLTIPAESSIFTLFFISLSFYIYLLGLKMGLNHKIIDIK
jgi:O-antigen ligase